MKKILRTGIALIFAAAVGIAVSCKDNKETTDETAIETTEMETTETMTTEVDTSGTVNDTNVSGTTSGEMEQVP